MNLRVAYLEAWISMYLILLSVELLQPFRLWSMHWTRVLGPSFSWVTLEDLMGKKLTNTRSNQLLPSSRNCLESEYTMYSITSNLHFVMMCYVILSFLSLFVIPGKTEEVFQILVICSSECILSSCTFLLWCNLLCLHSFCCHMLI